LSQYCFVITVLFFRLFQNNDGVTLGVSLQKKQRFSACLKKISGPDQLLFLSAAAAGRPPV
jgi:hypothetical protein